MEGKNGRKQGKEEREKIKHGRMEMRKNGKTKGNKEGRNNGRKERRNRIMK